MADEQCSTDKFPICPWCSETGTRSQGPYPVACTATCSQKFSIATMNLHLNLILSFEHNQNVHCLLPSVCAQAGPSCDFSVLNISIQLLNDHFSWFLKGTFCPYVFIFLKSGCVLELADLLSLVIHVGASYNWCHFTLGETWQYLVCIYLRCDWMEKTWVFECVRSAATMNLKYFFFLKLWVSTVYHCLICGTLLISLSLDFFILNIMYFRWFCEN